MTETYRRPLEHVEENELVELAKTEPSAFGELYERYVKRIYNYVYYRTGNHHDAEDLTARVFQRALTHIPRYENRGVPFSAWLYRIAHNLVVNWHRDRKRRQVVSIDDLTLSTFKADSPELFAEKQEQEDLLLRAIQQLPQDRQQLLMFKFVDKLSNAEVGEIMGRSEGAIKSLYHRTLLALRDEIQRIQSGVERKVSRQRRRRNNNDPT